MATSIHRSPPRIRLADRLDGIAPSMTLAITAKARALKAKGIDVCGFGSGEPDFDTPEHIKQAAIAALERGETKYATVEGIAKLREAIAKKLAVENGLTYKPSQVQVSGGAKQALYNLMMALVNPGDEVIIPAPYWLSYPEMVRLASGVPVILPTTEESRFKFTPADLEAVITPRSRILVIASPSNPTGVMYSAEELAAIARVAVERDLLIISDEIYEKLVYGEVVFRSIGSLGEDVLARTITINGFSKAYAMTGWRLGYAAGPQEIIDGANIVQSHSLSNVTTFAQYGAIAALDGDQSAVEMMRQAFAARLDVMYDGIVKIRGISCVRPDGAFYLFPSIKDTGLDSMAFSQRFLEQEHVAVVPGLAFGADDHIRFSYATDMETIQKGVERLTRFVGQLSPGESAVVKPAAPSFIGSSVIFRDLGRTYPIIERGEGIYLFDVNGRRYIDGSGGSAAVTNIGHGVKEVAAAAAEQLSKVAYVPMHMVAHRPLLDLADQVAMLAPGDLNRVWFVSGGSEATENAVKMARQYHLERGQPSKFKIISRWQSYHGATLGALAFGGHTHRRRKYVPMLNDQPKIPAAYRYRCAYCKAAAACNLECARSLEHTIRLEGPENVAAFIAEPIVGAALGAVTPPDGYFAAIRDICDRYEVLFIADEVMTGFGRTGRMFAMEHDDVIPDIVTAAKGISGGYTPLGAVIARDHIIEQFERNGSSFVGGHTYVGNPLSCAIGLAVIRYLLEHDLIANARMVGDYFLERLNSLRSHRIVGDVRGKGMLLGLEFVKDKQTREPFAPDQQVAARIGVDALERGLITYPGTGSVDGMMGDHMLFAPPLIITRDQVDELVGILDQSITAVEATLTA